MIITPDTSRQLISDWEEVEAPVPPSTSLLNQGALVIENNVLDEELKNIQLETLKKQTAEQIRQNASILNYQKDTERFNAMLQSTDDSQIIANSLQALNEKQKDNRIALEKEVIRIFENKSQQDPIQAYIDQNDIGFLERIATRETKSLAVQNKLQEIKEKGDAFDTGLNLLSEFGMVNFLQRTLGFGLSEYGSELRDLQSKIEAASPEETLNLLDEYEDLVRSTQILGDNPDFVYGELSLALQSSRDEQTFETVLNLLDFADTAFIAGGFVGDGLGIISKRGLSGAALNMGARDTVAQDIVSGSNKIVDDSIQATGLGSGLKTEFDTADALSSSVRKEYELNQRTLNEVLDNFRGMDYEEVQALDIFESIKDRLKKDFTNGSINDISMRSDGTAEVVITKASGNAYATEGSAKAALTSRGFEGSVFELPSGGYALKATVPALDAKKANLSTAGVTKFTQLLRRPEAWVDDDLLVNAQISENTMNAITKAGQQVYDRSVGRLSKSELQDMTPLMEKQVREERWLEPAEIDAEYRSLYGRPVTEKEMNAFSGYRLLNDFQYQLDNKVLYQKKKAKGFQSVNKDVFGFDINAKRVEDFEENDYIFMNDSLSTIEKTRLPEDFLNKYDVLRVDDLSRFSTRGGYEGLQENPTPYIAVPKGSAELQELSPFQLQYLAGGRVRYDSSAVYLKQPVLGTYSNGKRYRRNDKTLFTATSYPQAQRAINSINALNSILRKGADNPDVITEATAFLQKRSVLGTDNLVEYLEKVKARGMDITETVSVVRNREVINQEGLPSDFIDLGDSDFLDISNGRLSSRGRETVPHIDPDTTSVLNPVAALNQNFVASAGNAAFSAYREYTLSYLERYRKFLDVEAYGNRMALLDADIRRGSKLTKSQINKIQGEQQFAREVVGRNTEAELAAMRNMEELVNWAVDSKVGKILWKDPNKFTAKYGAVTTDDVIGRVRGLVFNAKLGLFSIPAAVIQAAHAPIIATMAPRHGIKALITYPMLRIGLASQDPAVVKYIASKADALDLKGYGNMEDFFSEFRRLGFDSFGSNMVYENAARGDNVVRTWGEKFADKGRMFFEEGELMPRMTAYATSVREWLANVDGINPKGLPITDKQASKYITQRTNTLTLGMTRADLQQGLKTGFMGLLAQFQSYPMRALDAMVFPSKNLSDKERLRMITGYMIMYGSAGLPMAKYFADYAADRMDEDTSDTAYKLLYNGVVDAMVMAATGEDTNFASRGGLGDWASEIIDSFAGGDKNFIEVLLGPAGSTGSGAVDTLVEYAKAWSAGYNPDPSQITTNVVMDIAKQVASVNNIHRAWIASQTGKIYDSRGRQFIDISDKGIILQFFGIPPQEYDNIGSIYTSREKRKQIIDLNVELMVKLHNQYARDPDPKILQQINAVAYYVQQDGLSQEVNSRVSSELRGDSSYNELLRQALVENNMGKEALSKELEVLND